MKTLLLLSLLGICTSVALRAATNKGTRMLHDLAHGQTPLNEPVQKFNQRIGLDVVESKEPLTTEMLAGVRLLYLRAPSQEFSAKEKEAIVNFVRSGGSLLLVLDEESRQSLAKTNVNDLIAPFGLKLTPDLPYLHNCGGLAKAGVINRADREIPYSGGRAVEGGSPFAFVLNEDGKPSAPFATSTILPSGGRVVVMAEGMASLIVLGKPEGVRLSGVPRDFRATTYWGKDSEVFMEEVFAWLVKR